MMPLFLTRIQPLFNSAKTSSSRLSVKVVIISDEFVIPGAICHKTTTEENQIRLITDSSFVLTGILSENQHDTCLYSGQQNLVDVMKEALKNKIELLGI